MINKLLVMTSLLLMGTIIAFNPTSTTAETITIKGSTTVLPIAQAGAEAFMNENPDVNVSVAGGGSGVGIAALIDRTCDIADASRPMKDKEIAKAKQNGITPMEHIVAKDGIAVIVHPRNWRTQNLTLEQIKDIYTGKVSDWKEISSHRGQIIVISRDSSSGTFEAFEKLALGGARVRPDALLAASNQAVVQNVARTPGAIGYVGLGYVSDSVKAVTVNDIRCTKGTVISGKYPLSRPLFMYTNGQPIGAVKMFLDFVLSERGQKIAEEQGYVGLK